MTVNRISEHNTPVVEARIAPAVFLLCPFNKSKVTAVDNMAVRILVQIGDHPEKTAGSRKQGVVHTGMWGDYIEEGWGEGYD